ncbi:hypothetical protein U9M48_023786 [Paspalum notatum var. saurae]|uniref:Uncharacterized protein n=1 Tax=Paspalum notatum var. saurae TaxID=547442 RepID=A0AAQ3TMG1_PASNO
MWTRLSRCSRSRSAPPRVGCSSRSGRARTRAPSPGRSLNTLERKLFYIPSFKIYHDVAGLYDYGRAGLASRPTSSDFGARSYLLVEFDDARHSCRKRLDRHNCRCRKPQPDAMSSAS